MPKLNCAQPRELCRNSFPSECTDRPIEKKLALALLESSCVALSWPNTSEFSEWEPLTSKRRIQSVARRFRQLELWPACSQRTELRAVVNAEQQRRTYVIIPLAFFLSHTAPSSPALLIRIAATVSLRRPALPLASVLGQSPPRWLANERDTEQAGCFVA